MCKMYIFIFIEKTILTSLKIGHNSNQKKNWKYIISTPE